MLVSAESNGLVGTFSIPVVRGLDFFESTLNPLSDCLAHARAEKHSRLAAFVTLRPYAHRLFAGSAREFLLKDHAGLRSAHLGTVSFVAIATGNTSDER